MLLGVLTVTSVKSSEWPSTEVARVSAHQASEAQESEPGRALSCSSPKARLPLVYLDALWEMLPNLNAKGQSPRTEPTGDLIVAQFHILEGFNFLT